MNRKEIHKGAIVRRRPGRYTSHNTIGRIVSDEIGTKSGYSRQTITIVAVEWYATVLSDGTVRTYAADEVRIQERTEARYLEIVNVDQLATSLREQHERSEAHRRQVQAQVAETDANVAIIRVALDDERWGHVRYNGGQIDISNTQLAALVAFVQSVVAS